MKSTEKEKVKKRSFGLKSLVRWAERESLWYYAIGQGCCSDEVLATLSARYDLERFGILEQVDPSQADLLLVCGAIPYRAVPEVQRIYQQMRSPKYVMAVGACAICGGAFVPENSYSVLPGVDRLFRVDVVVPGSPPRPEAIMHGILTLQKGIRGHS